MKLEFLLFTQTTIQIGCLLKHYLRERPLGCCLNMIATVRFVRTSVIYAAVFTLHKIIKLLRKLLSDVDS